MRTRSFVTFILTAYFPIAPLLLYDPPLSDRHGLGHSLPEWPSLIVVRLNSLTGQGCALSVVSLAELYEGVYFSSNPTGNEQALDDFLRGASVLGIDAETCKIFGQHRGRLRAKGKMVGDFDLLIGSLTYVVSCLVVF